jgi:hypothetical protein
MPQALWGLCQTLSQGSGDVPWSNVQGSKPVSEWLRVPQFNCFFVVSLLLQFCSVKGFPSPTTLLSEEVLQQAKLLFFNPVKKFGYLCLNHTALLVRVVGVDVHFPPGSVVETEKRVNIMLNGLNSTITTTSSM